MPQSFQPHQLDCDWRFDFDTQSRIAKEAAGADRVVLLGCPSLMNVLGGKVEIGVLLERNPNHDSINGFAVYHCDLRDRSTMPRMPYTFDLGIVDAPWYVDDLLTWLNLALSVVDFGKDVLFVVWPENIRPSAPEEHQRIWSALKTVGEIEHLGTVSYDAPLFERLTLQQAGRPRFLRTGLLVRLTKRHFQPLAPEMSRGPAIWKRFGIGETQVAIRVTAAADVNSDAFALSGEPFVLPTTSRREPSLKRINIWTSENVVGHLKNPNQLAIGLSEGHPSYLEFLNRVLKVNLTFAKEGQAVAWEHLE